MALPKSSKKTIRNLVPNEAPDKPKELIKIGVGLRPDQIEALDKLQGSRSYFVRQSVDLYLRLINQAHD